MKKVIVVGATGLVGSHIVRELAHDHDVIEVGRSGGTHTVDIQSDAGVRALFERVGQVDAIVSAVGQVHFGPVTDMTAELFNQGLQHKLLGQVRLALIGQHYLRPGGSITLTTGILAEEAILGSANAAAANAGIEAFVRAAAAELGDRRINAVSPTVLAEASDALLAMFPGFEAAPGSRVARAYRRSIDGIDSGRVYRVW